MGKIYGLLVRLNYFFFKDVFENEKYAPIRPTDALVSLFVTSLIVIGGCLGIFALLLPLMLDLLKVFVGVVILLYGEKLLLIAYFNRQLKQR